ncbi:MAG: ATP-binding protein, partial [Thiomicrorhabdus sp.]|nr:ATP-binding protein [Thiomicrorhabdus sp.]
LSSVLSFMTPNQKRVEIGLFELIVNGIEHGNLGIGYQEKTRLTAKGTLQAEIERRLDLPENQHKHVEICVERFNDCLQFMIKDCGQGFDYKSYLDYVANRSLHHHGRGIMIANQLSFDALDYQEPGSKVICKVNLN